MPRMRFGAVAQVPEVQAAVRLYEYLDGSGFTALWVPDSQSLMHEMTSSMALAAARTSRIQVHGGVTNPLTRHPAV